MKICGKFGISLENTHWKIEVNVNTPKCVSQMFSQT